MERGPGGPPAGGSIRHDVCGIAGFLDGDRFPSEEAPSIARAMAEAVAHRGPDDAGVWIDREAGAALAYRRLAIIDLSSAGRQPMESDSGRNVIVFNGEIYNHQDLRRRLDAGRAGRPCWRGRSDTETLLAAIECWGLEEALRAAVGMFALALWNRDGRTLHLARDRVGEKPLYYGWQNGAFLFGSELEALAAHPAFAGEVDRDALALLLRHGYVPSPWSIYEGVRKLPAGTHVTVAAGASRRRAGELPAPEPYWSLREVVTAGRARPFEGRPEDAADVLHDVLLQAVGRQMGADVPLGAFLSGGIDSSTVVALMQAQSEGPVRTFTIGFEEPGYDEAGYAKAVARHLRTEHTEMYVSAREARDVIPRLPGLYDEPFADHSQIPTFLVAGMARRDVTVALSGDGGDELFGGYEHFFSTPRIWRWLSSAPAPLRRFGARMVEGLLAPGSEACPARLLRRLPIGRGRRLTPGTARKLVRLARCRTPEELFYRHVSQWQRPIVIGCGIAEPETVLNAPANWPDADEFVERLMAVDTLSYLPDDILVKTDRAAMGVGLETRAPFLDHHVVELVWRLPLFLKIRNGERKWILRQVLHRHVPRRLTDRPKAGFSIPLAAWLRGPLRDWAEALLDEGRLRADGFFDWRPIRRKWDEHLSGREPWENQLWSVLMFQAWLGHDRQGRPTRRAAP